MELFYDCGGIKEVKTKILTIKVLKILSDPNNHNNDKIFDKLVCTISDLPEDKVNQLSLIDSYRILFESWTNTYNKNAWISRIQCDCEIKKEKCECSDKSSCSCQIKSNLLLIKHDLSQTRFVKSPIYEKTHKICGKDVELQPFKLKLLKDALNKNNDVLGLSVIKSINGNTKFDLDSEPINLYQEIREIVKEEEELLGGLITASKKCSNCGKEHTTDIGFHNAVFLNNK